MKTILLTTFTFALIILYSCGNNEADNKKKEQQIADSVAKLLTGKPMNDPENIQKLEKVKADSVEKANTHTADAAALKNITFDYDFDNKLFNKKSDIDGHIFNNSRTSAFKNFVFKVTGRDKSGNITETFTRTVAIYLSPKASSKFTLRFTDSNKTKSATMALIGAEEIK